MLLVLCYSPAYSAMLATAVTVVMLIWDGKARRLSGRLLVGRVMTALIDASRQIALIAAIIICAGLIVGGGPPDPRHRAMLYMTGWQPYSLARCRRLEAPASELTSPLSLSYGVFC